MHKAIDFHHSKLDVLKIQQQKDKMEKKEEYIDINKIVMSIVKKKKIFFITIPLAMIISYCLILGAPRYYTTSSKLVPELENSMNTGTLGSLASNFGIDLAQNGGINDAISPLLYPNLIEDNGFIASLFNIKFKSSKGDFSCICYEYFQKHQKVAWWNKALGSIKKLIPTKNKNVVGNSHTFNPYNLSKSEDDIMNTIRSSIDLKVDKKTGVITITTITQDPLISKDFADAITTKLQNFITEYRTKKAKRDVEHYKSLTSKAKADYEKARQLYASYSDANSDIVLESFKSKQEDLENDMQLKFNTYSTLSTQYQAAEAKLQERTPAFTLLQGASVPQKPSKPKRLIFVFSMTFLMFILDIAYIVFKEKKSV